MDTGGAFKVAIDGPSGVGKSTVSRRLAEKLGALYIDTGAMYRATAIGADRAGVDPNDEAGLSEFLSTMELGFIGERIHLNGVDFTGEIRGAKADKLASIYSSLPAVRSRLVDIQRELASKAERIVMEGRDIGTVVLKEAEIKFFLTATEEVRASRRYTDEKSAGKESLEDIGSAMRERDLRDKTRKASPLVKAKDAKEIDTGALDIDGVVDLMMKHIEERH
jgi:cytidylate kinase